MSIWKTILHLVIIYSVLFTMAFISFEIFSFGLPVSEAFILITASFGISLVTLAFFVWGRKKDDKLSAIHTFAALGLKFGLYLILILVFYFSTQIKGPDFLVTFFAIYLSFTAYLIGVLIKHLKANKINN